MEYQKLLNVDGLLNNKVETHPWQYKIIDDILEKDTFDKIKRSIEKISNTEKDDEYYSDGIWPNDFKKFDIEDVYDTIITLSKEFLQLHKQILEQFDPYLKSNIGYYNIPKFNYSVNGLESKIHDEGINKTLALVIYMIPENSMGTKLYSGSEEKYFVKDIEWKPNRGFLMCSQPGVSWHSYKNTGLPRYTLNLYYEKIESLSNITKSFPEDRALWFLNTMHENQLINYI
jgi:hypothetical protein